jgi:hypothetical protein
MNEELGQDWRTRTVVVGVVLGLLAAAQVASAAISPIRYRWYPDWAFAALQGAILVHPILLYPMWAALSRDGLAWRPPVGAWLGVVIVYVDSVSGCSIETVVRRVALSLVAFAFVAAGFWLVRGASGWQIVPFGVTPAGRVDRSFRFQYRLRHLLEGMLLAACVLAAFRIYFPHGITFPHDVTRSWKNLGWEILGFAPAVAILLPPVVVPWAILTSPGWGRRTWLIAIVCWLAWDCSLVWIIGLSPRAIPTRKLGEAVLFLQFGASVASLISALVFRWLGYRIVRGEPEKETATGE